MRTPILSVIKDGHLTYHQKMRSLAGVAENLLVDALAIDPEAKKLMDDGLIDDLAEGHAPYRPRYVLPRYNLLLEKGCQFLQLPPAKTLSEAIHYLLIFYQSIPSITSYPVYLGDLDLLLEPFLEKADEGHFGHAHDLAQIKLFLIHLDRIFPSSFTHANLSPNGGRAAQLILEAIKELKQTVPNLTLKYDPKITPDEFARKAIETGLIASAPSFANHVQYTKDWGEDGYGIASCYNGLPVGGGSYTLVRMNLLKVARKATSLQSFLDETIPHTAKMMIQIMDERIRYLIEESHFFDNNFLVTENFIDPKRFIAMFGLYGMAEATEHLLPGQKYGHSEENQKLTILILKKLESILAEHKKQGGKNRYLLHAQSGIDTDTETTAGCRIPPGQEPALLDHLLYTAPIHHFFPTGVSDIFTFDQTAESNTNAILDIIRGAMDQGMRMFAFYSADSDLVRITGFLVKRSDIEKFHQNSCYHQETVPLGDQSIINAHLLKRKTQDLS